MHTIIFEQLIKNKKSELHQLYDFLGLDKDKGYQKLPKPLNSPMIWNNPLCLLFFNKPHLQKFLIKRGKGALCFGQQVSYAYQLPHQAQIDKLKSFYKSWNKKLENLLSVKLDFWL